MCMFHAGSFPSRSVAGPFSKVLLLGVVGVGADVCVVVLVQLQAECLGGRLVPPLKPNMTERSFDYCEDFYARQVYSYIVIKVP
jgi:hypothetical protein